MKLTLIFVVLYFAFGHGAVLPRYEEDSFYNDLDGESKAYDPSQVMYWLYTRATRDTPTQMFIGDLNSAPIDFSQSTKYIIHGYTQSGFDRFVIDMKDAYLDQAAQNVIAVDWKDAANGLYNVAQNNAQSAGATVGEFMAYLKSQGGNVKDMHCIGFSLGAHVCGNAGKQHYDDPLLRITGLDPAGPLYSNDRPWERLNSTDADFVDVMHTNAGNLGFDGNIGQVDFWPNGGTAQKGCWWDPTGACDHGRAHEFYTESILLGGFTSTKCTSYAEWQNGVCNGNEQTPMGDPTPSTVRGAFYLDTNPDPPFSMG